MCTALSYKSREHYFGRNLDLEYSFHEQVTISPRNYPFQFRNGHKIQSHYAIIGMATISDNFPLYYEATNEKGLSIAGLNFPGNAVYHPKNERKTNIASFELIPWILCQCKNTVEALQLLKEVNLWNTPFSDAFPLSPLHWMLSDRDQSFTLEPLQDGLMVHHNPIGVLTNNPPFEYHLYHLSEYLNLTSNTPTNRFSEDLDLNPFSFGMGSVGLPGDPSSPSRFVKASFVKWNSKHESTESAAVNQCFHILSSVAQQKGITHVKDGKYEFTLYTSCCNTDRGIYYYTTYENSCITAVSLYQEDLNSSSLIAYPMRKKWIVHHEN